VLVTGAAGFLGRHVARHFAERGHEVTGLGHGGWSAREAAEWGIRRWHAGDVDPPTLRAGGGEPAIVVHCAGGSLVAASFRDPFADFRRTVEATAAVLDFVRERAPAARVVYPSSAAVYGAAERLPIAEGDRLAPMSPYGSHKLAAEELCRSFARHFGLSVAIVRFFSLYGPHLRKQLLWDACGKLGAGDGRFAGTGAEVRDWLHVEDATRLLACAARVATPDCPLANGGTGVGTAIRDVLAELAAALGGGAAPIFTAASRSGDPPAYIACTTVAETWGFRPEIDWRSGVRDYARWYRRGADSGGALQRSAGAA
jgi:UDP-glucose 4-epimerase